VPLGSFPTLDYIDADESARRLSALGVRFDDASGFVQLDIDPMVTSQSPPTESIPVLT
jgi:hypothetical protein